MDSLFFSNTVLWVAVGYFSGSIPYGFLLTYFAGMGDIRAIGSGNIGATNVFRTGHKGIAIATLLLDGLKGFVPTLFAVYYAPDIAYQVATAAILGHIFPICLLFKGGKGVATSLGVFYALAWPVALTVCLIWLIAAKIFRISSLSALIGFAFAPVAAWLIGNINMVFFTLVILILIVWTHRSNIQRLLKGEEKSL